MWAFSDESERAGLSLLAVVMVEPRQVDAARLGMRRLLLGGERSLHMAKESDRRRRQILDVIARTDGLEAVVLRHRRPQGVDRVAARVALIEAATRLVVERAVTVWTLDNMHPAERARDRTVITAALRQAGPVPPVAFDHRASRSEPLLWVADAVCWAIGAGRDWPRRIQPSVTVVNIGP